MSGCLVTEPWSPPEQADVPPIIQADPSNPSSPKIGSIVWLNSDPALPREWEFAVVVIAEDLLRPLEARWRIVKRGEQYPAYSTLPTLPAGSRERHVTIKVSSSRLTNNECHHLELAVSGSFFKDKLPGVDSRVLFEVTTTGREQDLAIASWWLWAKQGNMDPLPEDSARIVESCDAKESIPTGSATTQEVQ